METTIADFFQELDGRGYEPALEKAHGSLRFDVVDDGARNRWFLSIDGGHVRVSRRNARADCVIRAPASVLRSVVAGGSNAMAAVLRGAMTVEGDLELLLRFQRILPGPGEHGTRAAGGDERP